VYTADKTVITEFPYDYNVTWIVVFSYEKNNKFEWTVDWRSSSTDCTLDKSATEVM